MKTPKRSQRARRAPKRRAATSRKKTRTVSLRNFTGKVRLNPDETVSIMGMGRKKRRK